MLSIMQITMVPVAISNIIFTVQGSHLLVTKEFSLVYVNCVLILKMATEKPNFAYKDYLFIELILPLFVPMLVINIGELALPIGMIVVTKHNHCLATAKGICNKILLKIFGSPIGILNSIRVDHDNVDSFFIGTNEVPETIYCGLILLMVIFLHNSCVVFWDYFLLQESFTCDDKTIDCFITQGNEATNASSYELVKNCSLYEDVDVEFICFRFTFSIKAGLAAVGILFSAFKIKVKVVSAIALWFYGCIPAGKVCCGFNCRNFIYILVVVPSGIAGGIAAIVLYINLSLSSTASTSGFSYFVSLYKFSAVLFTIVLGVLIPWQTVLQSNNNNYEDLGSNSNERTGLLQED